MHIVFLNGNRFTGRMRDVLRALWHPLFVALVLGMTGIIMLLHPYDDFMPDAVMPQTLILCSSIVVFLAASLAVMSQSQRWPILAHSFPLLIVAVVVASFWGVSLSALMGGQALGVKEWAQLLAFNTLFCTVGEVFLSTFLLKRIVVDTREMAHPVSIYMASEDGGMRVSEASDVATTTDDAPQWVELLGQRVAIDDVWHLKAEEHYVAVGLQGGRSLLLRGRLTDAIAQLPEGTGMQVHRSHWVASTALAAVRCVRTGCYLRLHGGAEVPVARNRKAEVKPWAMALLQPA